MCVWGKRGKRRRKREGGKVGEKGEREGQNDGGRRGSGARAREGEGEKKGEVVTERGRKGKRMGETRGFEKPTRRMPFGCTFNPKCIIFRNNFLLPKQHSMFMKISWVAILISP